MKETLELSQDFHPTSLNYHRRRNKQSSKTPGTNSVFLKVSLWTTLKVFNYFLFKMVFHFD